MAGQGDVRRPPGGVHGPGPGGQAPPVPVLRREDQDQGAGGVRRRRPGQLDGQRPVPLLQGPDAVDGTVPVQNGPVRDPEGGGRAGYRDQYTTVRGKRKLFCRFPLPTDTERKQRKGLPEQIT